MLSALPIVNLGNCCCCLWVVAGGMLAVYLRQQNSPFAVTSSEGALVGLLAGLFGGILGVVLSIPIEMAMGSVPAADRRLGRRAEPGHSARDARHAGARRQGRRRRRSGGLQLRDLSVIGAVFGMLGGLLGVAVFKKNAPPPPPPGTMDVLPPEG